MSWVEELKPDDEVEVEFIYPKAYVEHNISTMRRYAAGISNICKGYALLGETETEFLVFGMTVVQVITLEETMRRFGINLEHENGKLSDGTRFTYFYADLQDLIKKMEEGEIE